MQKYFCQCFHFYFLHSKPDFKYSSLTFIKIKLG